MENLKLRPVLAIRVFAGDTKAFGPGIATLLRHVDALHSLRKAAAEMGMAYSKAWRIVNEAEGQLGCKLIERDGARGSTLTPRGRRALEAYLDIQAEVDEVLRRRARELE